MNKLQRLTIGVAAGALVLATAVPVLAKGPSANGNGPAGNSPMSHLYLFEKCETGGPNSCTWDIVDGGAWGKMSFNDDFTFNGHGLEPGTEYTLIRYTDPWPGTPLACLANGTSNGGGNLSLSGDMVDGGIKVWLVLSADVDCSGDGMMDGWSPTEYLFEYDVLPVLP